MLNRKKHNSKLARGQALVEYALLLAIASIGLVWTVNQASDSIRGESSEVACNIVSNGRSDCESDELGAGSDGLPVARFTYSCTSGTCNFDGSTSFDTDGEIVRWEWEINGTAASGSMTDHSFMLAGDFPVTLTVYDNDGNSDSDTQLVRITDPDTPVDPFCSSSATIVYNGPDYARWSMIAVDGYNAFLAEVSHVLDGIDEGETLDYSTGTGRRGANRFWVNSNRYYVGGESVSGRFNSESLGQWLSEARRLYEVECGELPIFPEAELCDDVDYVGNWDYTRYHMRAIDGYKTFLEEAAHVIDGIERGEELNYSANTGHQGANRFWVQNGAYYVSGHDVSGNMATMNVNEWLDKARELYNVDCGERQVSPPAQLCDVVYVGGWGERFETQAINGYNAFLAAASSVIDGIEPTDTFNYSAGTGNRGANSFSVKDGGYYVGGHNVSGSFATINVNEWLAEARRLYDVDCAEPPACVIDGEYETLSDGIVEFTRPVSGIGTFTLRALTDLQNVNVYDNRNGGDPDRRQNKFRGNYSAGDVKTAQHNMFKGEIHRITYDGGVSVFEFSVPCAS